MIEFKIDEFRNAYFKKKKIFSIFVENLKKKRSPMRIPLKIVTMTLVECLMEVFMDVCPYVTFYNGKGMTELQKQTSEVFWNQKNIQG